MDPTALIYATAVIGLATSIVSLTVAILGFLAQRKRRNNGD